MGASISAPWQPRSFTVVVAQDGTGDYNGSTSTTINQALLALDALGGGVCMVKKGTYTTALANKITVFSNCVLQGEGSATIIQFTDGGGDHIVAENVASAGSDNIQIKNLVIDANNQNASGFAAYNARGFLMRDVEVKDVAGATSSDGYGVYFEDCDRLRLENLYVHDIAQRDGIQLKGCQDVYIVDCLVKDVVGIYGIDIHKSAARINKNVQVIKPIILSCTRGIDVAGADHYILDSPIIRDCTGWAIDIRETVTYAEIRNPQIYNVSATAITDTNASSAGDIKNLHIIGGVIDTVTGASNDGIFVTDSENVHIIGVRIKDCGRRGINTKVTATRIVGCTITGSGGDGVFLEANSCRVVGTDSNSNTGYGIREYTGKNYNVLTECRTVSNTGGTIVTVGANTITANNITN